MAATKKAMGYYDWGNVGNYSTAQAIDFLRKRTFEWSDRYAQNFVQKWIRAGKVELVVTTLEVGGSLQSYQKVAAGLCQKAVEKKSVDVLVALIDAGAEVNCKVTWEDRYYHKSTGSLLLYCLEKGWREGALLLLSRGADASTVTPLCYWMTKYKANEDLIIQLLDAGADLSPSKSAADGYGIVTSPLLLAVEWNQVAVVAKLLELGADVTYQDRAKRTLLEIAVTGGHVDVSRLLLDANADPDTTMTRGSTVLYHATAAGNINLMRVLVEKGADANKPTSKNKTPLECAVTDNRVDAWALLLQTGADPDTTMTSGSTVLYHATATGNIALMQALIDRGADSNKPTLENVTPLERAATDDCADAWRLLLEAEADPNTMMTSGATVLYHATTTGDTDLMRALIDKGADSNKPTSENKTPLERAVTDNRVDAWALLLEAGADPDTIMTSGSTVLYHATATANIELMRALIDRGADSHKPTSKNVTPLERAVTDDCVDAWRLLLEANADPDTTMSSGSTVLYHATATGNIDLMRALIEKKADSNKLSSNGQVPLHIASSAGNAEAVDLLIAASANVALLDANDRTPLEHAVTANAVDVQQLLLAARADVDTVMSTGSTVLYHSTANNYLESMALLIGSGADVNKRSANGDTPLHIAPSADALKQLLAAGADPSIRNSTGNNALHCAATHGNQHMISILLNADVDTDAINKEGDTPLQVALASNNGDLADMIEKHMKERSQRAKADDQGNLVQALQAILAGQNQGTAAEVEELRAELEIERAERAALQYSLDQATAKVRRLEGENRSLRAALQKAHGIPGPSDHTAALSNVTNYAWADVLRATAEFDEALVVGTGASGNVYRADFNGEELAVKVFLLNAELADEISPERRREMFQDELAIAAACDHPNVVKLIGHATNDAADGGLALVTEYGELGNLADYIRDHPGAAFPAAERLAVLRAFLAGLVYLHDHSVGGGVVAHRDIKAANIVLTRNVETAGGGGDVGGGGGGGGGSSLLPKIIDFGTAHTMETKENQTVYVTKATSVNVYTDGYEAPEVSGGVYGVSTDMYAVGVIILELLTGLPANSQNQGKLTGKFGGLFSAKKFKRLLDAEAGWDWDNQAFHLIELALGCTASYEDRPSSRRALQRVACLCEFISGVPDACSLCGVVTAEGRRVECTASSGRHLYCRPCASNYVGSVLQNAARMKESDFTLPCSSLECECELDLTTISNVDGRTQAAFALFVQRYGRHILRQGGKGVGDGGAGVGGPAAPAAAVVNNNTDEDPRGAALTAAYSTVADLMNLDCPGCFMPFYDFDWCAAIVCEECGTAYCAVCLAECEDDAEAHRHVSQNHGGDAYVEPEVLDAGNRAVRIERVREFLLSVGAGERAAVAEHVEPLFIDFTVGDLGPLE